MSEMVERVARAIVKAGGDDPDALLRWPDPDPCWKGAIPEAKAAIAAMQGDADIERIKRERDQAVEALRLFVKLIDDPDYDLGELCEEFCTRAETILASIEGTGHE